MTDTTKPINVTFAPGCFDDFEGTQEELDLLMSELVTMFSETDVFKNAKVVSLDETNVAAEEWAALDADSDRVVRGQYLQ